MNDPAEIQETLRAVGLSVGYRHVGRKHTFLAKNLNLVLNRGQVTGLLGPNGSGKSTLLRTLGGLQPALQGSVTVLGVPVSGRNIRQTARLISLVLTEKIDVKNLTVFSLVSMGRYPHNSWTGRLDKKDRLIVGKSLDQVHLSGFASAFANELSDGEQQRVLIARALAQDTPLIILDEPTAHLDLPGRISIMHLLKTLADETCRSILFSSHDLELTLEVIHALWLLKKGGEFLTGDPATLMKAGAFEQVFSSEEDPAGQEAIDNYFSGLRNKAAR